MCDGSPLKILKISNPAELELDPVAQQAGISLLSYRGPGVI